MRNKSLFSIVRVLLLATSLIGCQTLRREIEISSTPENRLSSIKVAVVYETIMDRFVVDGVRDTDAAADLFTELKTDYIHRGFYRWRGFAEFERKADV